MDLAVEAVSSSAGVRLLTAGTRPDPGAPRLPVPSTAAPPPAPPTALPSAPPTPAPSTSATSTSAPSDGVAVLATQLPDSLLAARMAKADVAVMLKAMQAYREAMRALEERSA